MKKLFLLLFCLFLGACTSLPRVMKNTHVESVPVKNVTYAQAMQNIDAYNSASVRWGGIIVGVENERNFSLIQTLFYQLNHSGEPQLDKPAEGRFVIKSTDFFDPIIYANNRKITVVGTLNGKIEHVIGKRNIQIPLIQSSTIHLWPKEKFHDFNDYYYNGHKDDWEHGD